MRWREEDRRGSSVDGAATSELTGRFVADVQRLVGAEGEDRPAGAEPSTD